MHRFAGALLYGRDTMSSASIASQVALTVAVSGFSAILQRLSVFGFALFATPLLAIAMPVRKR